MFEASRKRSQLEKLIGRWMAYKEAVTTRMGASDVSAGEEREFLKLKGKIAENMAGLSRELGMDKDNHAHFQAMTYLLNRYPTLYADQLLDEQQRSEFEHNWHDHYLFFNQLKGVQGKPDKPLPTGKGGHAPTGQTGAVSTKTVVFRVLLLVVVGMALVRFIPWHRIGAGISAHGYAQALKDFIGQAWASTRSSVNSLDGPHLGGVFQPAMEKYGQEAATVMIAVLLLAVGYWIFIRMK